MQKILFVCHGNICRSVSAQYVFQDMVNREGLQSEFFVGSAATSREEIGNPVYPPMEKTLKAHGVPILKHRARQLARRDYDDYDYLIGMDDWNIHNILRIVGSDPGGKICQLLDFTGEAGEIPDPWYTRDFEGAYQAIVRGCDALLDQLRPW